MQSKTNLNLNAGLTVRLPQAARAELERRAATVGGRPGGLARKLILDGLKTLPKQGDG